MAVIFDVQRGCLHDGPGIRTAVFFKGCPLRCRWCHNPEGWDPQPQTLRYPDRCVSCGREMTVEEVLAPILADKPYYGADGGVTLTGGEPQLQADFALALTEACEQNGIGVAIETSMAVYRPDLLRRMRLIIADVKVWDKARHREHTGVDNTAILEHIRQADALGVPILVRTPVIPTINDRVEEIAAIRDFVQTLRNGVGYELMPYHSLGLDKAQALGVTMPRFPDLDPAKLDVLRACAQG